MSAHIQRGWQIARAGGFPFLMAAVLIVMCGIAPLVWGHAATIGDLSAVDQGMSARHWFGTDDLGRDILARTLVATRSSILLAVGATLVGGCLGSAIGLAAAVITPISRVVSAIIGVLLAFPALLLAIFFDVVFGIGSVGAVLAVGASFTPGFARMAQALASAAVGREYVQASKILGKSVPYVVGKHILPNCAEPLLLYTAIQLGHAVIALAGLSFLGLGVQVPQFDWGQLLNNGLPRMYTIPTVVIAPAAAIAIAGLTFNLLGERLSDMVSGRRAVGPGGHRSTPLAPLTSQLASEVGDGADTPQQSDGLLVDVRHLRVVITTPSGAQVTPVRDVSFTIAHDETLGIVGESGSGKSMTASAVAQLLPPGARVEAARITFRGVDLAAKPDRRSGRVLGSSLATVFQEPGDALNPALRVGTQMTEPAIVHLRKSKASAYERALSVLRSVSINEPERRFRQYQHELSGGMKQRICIAIGLMGEPRLLIADEPTTALDVTVQKQILDVIASVRDRYGAGVLYISHDIAVVSKVCDRVIVMYAGFVVEQAPVDTLLNHASHPYTVLLLAVSPTMSTDRSRALATLDGRMPGPGNDLPGCYFAARCPRADSTCIAQRPPLRDVGGGHSVACWHPVNQDEGGEQHKPDPSVAST